MRINGPTHYRVMALTSTSSLADAIAQYKDNLLWDGDVTKSRAALEAIRFIRMTRPSIMAKGDFSVTQDQLAGEQQQIERFLAAFDTANQPQCSFTRARALL